jgi:small subunit ribosomal protein S3
LGQKVHPTGFRLGIVKGWQSRWYAERDYKDILAEDFLIRSLINKELANASVSKIEIERAAASQVTVTIHTAKPGIVIGKSGEKVDKLRTMLEAKCKKRVRLNILEIRQPELDAYLVGRSIAEQLEKRVAFRRAMKQAVQKSMRANAKGVKVIIGGRLGGAEIARSEKEVEGKIPLHTLRADIDYGLAEAHTTFGVIGIKVWIYKGDILPSKRREAGEVGGVQPQQEAVQPMHPSFAQREREGGDRRGGDRRRSSEGGQRGDRGPRPQGDRPYSGDRGPRQTGDRPPRPQGDRPVGPSRPQGERFSGSGDRPQRPPQAGQGDRPQPQGQVGEPRAPRQPRPQGERVPRPQGERVPRPQGERAPRPQGDRPPRPQGDRVPRPQGDRPPRQQAQAENAPAEQSTPVTPPVAPEVTQVTQVTPPTPPTPDTGATQSE